MKNIKDYILEGSWGYEIDQNDGTLDLRADIYSKICELVYDECDKYSKGKDTSWAWEALGAIEYFFEDLTKLEDFGFTGSKSELEGSAGEPSISLDVLYLWNFIVGSTYSFWVVIIFF